VVLAASLVLAVLTLGEAAFLFRLPAAYDPGRATVLQFMGLFFFLLAVVVSVKGIGLSRRLDRPSSSLVAGTLISIFTAIALAALEIGLVVVRFVKSLRW